MRNKPVLFGSVLAVVLLLSACGPAISSTEARTLSVSGTGTVYLTPDIAYLYVGVHIEDADIAAAVQQNNAKTQALIDVLTSLGVAAKDIQTSNFSIWSTQDYNNTGEAFTKYVVDNTVYITVRDLESLGTLLNAVVEAGANSINSITFDVADKSAALADARTLAMSNADALAQELAATAGLSVGEIQNITYSEYSPSPYYGMGGGGAAPQAATVPIQPGQLEVSVTVNVTYAIK